MRVSFEWLREYAPTDRDPRAIAEALLGAGLEVSEFEDLSAGLEKVVVAELISVSPHPNADRLTICDVRTPERTHRIVCGAKNMKAGDRVALALPGARLPAGMEIRRSKIRGEVSEGMMCSETELKLAEESAGILILPADAPVGKPLADYLGRNDTVLEIDLTPNRPDCLSHVGVAREVAALTGSSLRVPEPEVTEAGEPVGAITSVQIEDPDRCPRYAARVIRGVHIGPSPPWLRARLEKVGVRPINNVVDVTNYVLFELGQPLHAFDLARLREGRIVVRRARAGEELATLDGEARKLDPDDLAICDAERPVALAGVMGGEATEVSDRTTDILLESAYFSQPGIRRTAKRHGLKTESSHRFERGCDPEMVVRASDRAAALLAELAGGQVASGALDVYPAPVLAPEISLDPARANALLGLELKPEAMAELLGRLGMEVEAVKGEIRARAPSWRPDLTLDVDLVEEIARLHGYDGIPTTLPAAPIEPAQEPPDRRVEKVAREVYTALGFHEAITYRFIASDWPDRLRLGTEDLRRRLVRLQNPLREDQAVMRTSLLPGLLSAAQYNYRRDQANVRLFEVGKVFFDRSGDELPEEREAVAGILLGEGEPGYWGRGVAADFYHAKGVVQSLLDHLLIRDARFSSEGASPCLHPGVSARLIWEKVLLGEVGRINPEVALALELPENLYLMDLDAGGLRQAAEAQALSFRPLPRFPMVRRDLAVVVDEGVEAGALLDRIRSIPDERFQTALQEVRVFDVYRGEGVPRGKKSVALRLSYRAGERTLTDGEVGAFQDQVLSRLTADLGAELRT
jgi:phenylalanyl-tRNA synthetase beta chain